MESEYIARNGREINMCLKVLYCEGIQKSIIEAYETSRGKLYYRVVFEAKKDAVDRINNVLNIYNS